MTLVQNEGVEILRVLCGSRAYGLNGPDSDFDYHAVYVVPTYKLLTIGPRIKDTAHVGESEDNTAWEIKHFLELALKGNSTVLETFVGPRVDNSTLDNMVSYQIGTDLRNLFPAVLSRKAVYDSFRGYASSQLHKMNIQDNPRRNLKAALAYLRTMYHGVKLLKSGTYETEVDPAWRAEFMQFKTATEFTPELMKDFNSFKYIFEQAISGAYEQSSIPEEADLKKINEFLLRVRKVW